MCRKIDISARNFGSGDCRYVCSTNQARTLSDALRQYIERNDRVWLYGEKIHQFRRAKIAYCTNGIYSAQFSE